MAKIYAVRNGRKTGIFDTFEECEKQVKGFSGAEFKSFNLKSDAEKYLDINNLSSSTKLENLNQNRILYTNEDLDTMHAFVDGSFNLKTGFYGAGVYIIHNDLKTEIKQKGNNPAFSKMRNVAGEILAAELAIKHASSKNVKNLIIYYDYFGIEKWCTGEWKTKMLGTAKYREIYLEHSVKINIKFIKIKAHSKEKNNEIADRLAKESLI
ncbi:ribonuclease H [Methanococcus vannielii SB]|uniref:Ribonuclease H n=1 Tax=Methanococcus vannielii (strain ATCC 35089 / DSM 1224 / JCM 13029 / OCM 148 / SB) TaxID=406327 RepID=A6USP2_METVS|nr:ribonuclease H family protein [Methanococcus vannielii]ABR55514.1 ribonuclease H [Methanococcus vannielii SB]